MEMSKIMSILVVVAAMVLMASFASSRRVDVDEGMIEMKSSINAERGAVELIDVMVKAVKGTGSRCSGSMCLDDWMACAPGCGCLVGVCYGSCC